MNEQQLEEEIARLRRENESLREKQTPTLALKVSEKGAVSLYGLGRFPVTLYKEQWISLLSKAKEIEQFIREHEHLLKAKS